MVKQYIPNPPKKSFFNRLFWRTAAEMKIDGMTKFFTSKDSYLVDQGWFLSARKRKSVGAEGKPLPWLTYPLINFIEPKLSKKFSMFEYGSGNSTMWFADHVGFIQSVDHDELWYRQVLTKLPSNATLMLEKIDGDQSYSAATFLSCDSENNYSSSVSRTGKLYDIILVDGVYRSNSVVHSVKCLTKEGIIIVDNVDYVESLQATDYLKNAGFRRIDFWGMCPIVHHGSCTAVFYRDGNCLDI